MKMLRALFSRTMMMDGFDRDNIRCDKMERQNLGGCG